MNVNKQLKIIDNLSKAQNAYKKMITELPLIIKQKSGVKMSHVAKELGFTYTALHWRITNQNLTVKQMRKILSVLSKF